MARFEGGGGIDMLPGIALGWLGAAMFGQMTLEGESSEGDVGVKRGRRHEEPQGGVDGAQGNVEASY